VGSLTKRDHNEAMETGKTKQSKIGVGGLFVVLGVGGLLAVLWLREPARQAPSTERPQRIALTEAQRAERPPGTALVEVILTPDAQGYWQASIGDGAHLSAGARTLGFLHTQVVPGSVETPVYICEYPEAGGATSSSLSLESPCTGKAKLRSEKPIGYTSRLIRTGYLLATRCRSPRQGRYVSFNPSCSEKEDRFEATLGALRADP